ncbi:SURF1 family protein [Marinobacter salinisoli]|uniref:SURF1-like protein n=1 Tax=Marinobacter salinisoli TaxID=2769486 RepID=A0ABX7MTI9_9GAMM|nr:SURF1 family protein [Marinobacter salinisoli]QSP95623.1 SURF1 family protein [Marinobacter salinisoli]
MSERPERSRQWQFDWRFMVFAGVFLPLLIGLGLWQLDRAGQKQALLDQWQLDVLQLSWPELVETELQSGRPVTLEGRYDSRSWLLDNRTRDGAPGYEVLTVFQPLEGPPLVVNRGWVQAPRTRDRLPTVDVPEGTVAIKGRLSEYPEPPVLVDASEPEQDWPRRVQTLPREIVARVAPEVPGVILRLAGPAEPGAFRADWQPDLMGPQTHYGYATQWFALALALVVLTLVASYRKTGANNDNDNG